MKSTIVLILLTTLGWLWGQSPATDVRPESIDVDCQAENTVFQDGEEIVYSLYYHLSPVWLKAGEVTFSVKDHGETYTVTAVGTTVGTFEWFYKVHDVYTTVIDKATLRPLRSERDISEGSYRKVSIASFDYENGVILAQSGKTRDSMKEFVIDMDSCTHDILSVIYLTRNLPFDDLEEGAFIPANVFLDKKKYDLGFIFDGIEEKKKIKKIGKTSAYLLRPQLVKGYVFEEDTEMKIWASTGPNRVPLMIESPVSVGQVKAVLKSYEGLKHGTSF